jgi:hypothetical protein
MFNVYTPNEAGALLLTGEKLTAEQVVSLCPIHEPTFKLSLDGVKVHTLLRVLDIYSRVLMNQWEYLKELTDDRWDGRRADWHSRNEEAVKSFKEPWTGYSMNASSGIYGPAIHPDAQIVWNVQKAVRHWDCVQRLGYSFRGVSSDAPLRGDQWPMVDGDASAGLLVLPVGGGIIKEGERYYVVEKYTSTTSQAGPSLAVSYSPVSLLDSLAYNQAHPDNTPTF